MPAEPAAGSERPIAESPGPERPPWPIPILILGLVALFGVVVLRTAWLSEDAYFTFRSVDNWVAGYGARWNVSERVQVYTHPLWFGLMSLLFFVTRDMAASAFALCFMCTAGTIYVLVRRLGSSREGTALALAVLIASKAFTDYSTSGLENPLSHLLLLAFFARAWSDEDPDPAAAARGLFVTCSIGALLVCNRMDLGLVLAPALVYALWPPRLSLRRVLAVGLGFAPLFVWELVSLVYYGFLLPNTAYAKLGSSAARPSVLRQGARYFENSLEWDPVTLICIAVVTLASLRQFRARPKHACAALGVLLYLAYVLSIGGDYMSGRFFSAPLVVAAGLLANRAAIAKPVVRVSAVVIVILAFMAPNPTVLSGRDYGEQRLESDELIDDERGYRHLYAGLISERDSALLANEPWSRQGRRHREVAAATGETLAIVDHNGGYMGYAAGPRVHYINPYAITDPLLARLPGSFDGPGHISRRPPKGYRRAAVGDGEILDPNLAAYWDELSLIVSGPIWSKARWAAIWRMHTGADQQLLDAYLHQDLDYADVASAEAPPTWLRSGGATITLDALRHQDRIEVWVERDDVYAIELYRGGERVHRHEFGETSKTRKNSLTPHRIAVPAEIATTGYDELLVVPVEGDGVYRMGRLRLLTEP